MKSHVPRMRVYSYLLPIHNNSLHTILSLRVPTYLFGVTFIMLISEELFWHCEYTDCVQSCHEIDEMVLIHSSWIYFKIVFFKNFLCHDNTNNDCFDSTSSTRNGMYKHSKDPYLPSFTYLIKYVLTFIIYLQS